MHSGLKVLIIEDRRENIVFLANNILKPKGFDVITAMDGEAGLRKALEEHPDIIITDLKLPKMHGLDILADLQDRGSTIPAIVMTFHGSEETAIRAFRLGAKDYLIKPFNVDDMEAALDRAISGRQSAPGESNEALERRAKTLEEEVAALKKTIEQQQQATPSQSADPALLEKLQVQAAQHQAEITRLEEECARLNDLLARQQALTTEARNSAKAMVQFIRQQQKEVARQQKTAAALKKQMQTIADGVAGLAANLEAQARQFHSLSPHS